MSAGWGDLPLEERIKRFEELWESLVADPQVSPLTPEQKAELDRRLDAYERDGDPGRPMDEVLEEIEERLRRR